MVRRLQSLSRLKNRTIMITKNYTTQPVAVLNELFRNFAPQPAEKRWNWTEKDDAWKGELDLPGFTKEEVKISLDKDRILTVEAKQKELAEGETRDFSRNDFSYQLGIPREADAEKLAANLENGVLSITLPKVTPDSQIERRIELN